MAGEDVLEPLALAVAQVPHRVDLERPGTGRGAEQAAPEARALLVGPAHPPRAVRTAREPRQLAQVLQHAVGVHDATGARLQLSERGTKRPCPGRVRVAPRS